MKNWSEYSLADGVFTGITMSFSTGPDDLELNTRVGFGWREGLFDRLTQRVDCDHQCEEGELQPVVDWQPPPPAPEVLAAQARADRASRLAACDWTQVADGPLAPPQRAAWAVYRQALRDISEQPDFPSSVVWPTPPN